MRKLCLISQKIINLIIFLFFLVSLAIAFSADIIYKILPCQLCVYLRYIYWPIIALSALRIKWPFHPLLKWAQLTVVIAALGLSGFHVGVEKKWWEGPSFCSNPVLQNDNNKVNMTVQQRITMIRQNIESSALVRCDRVNWHILGVSVTIWNTLALTVITLILLSANRRLNNAR